MKRLLRVALVAWLVLGAGRLAFGQAVTVNYLDRGTNKRASVRGTIKGEGPAGLKVESRGGVKVIPALDVLRVTYDLKGTDVPELDYRRPFGKEDAALEPTTSAKARKKDLEDALQAYQELDARLRTPLPSAHRYLRYKAAHVKALLAQDDPARLDDAVAALAAYRTDNPGTWEVVPCLKELAQLQEQKGDAEAAGKTYAELAALPGLPKELKEQSDIWLARLLVRSGKYDRAEKKLQDLRTAVAKDDPQRGYIDVYLAQCRLGQGHLAQVEAPLRETIRTSPDANVKGLAHNLLGDYYRHKNQAGEAFWEYLKVDMLYNQDREEHAKALYHLWKLFDKEKNDPMRAAEFLERLRGKPFAGTFYQAQALKEQK
jgi:hypothetical protein